MPSRYANAAPPTVLLATLMLGGCVHGELPSNPLAMKASAEERDCMARAMYFESNRSSTDGMLAVGTTVMNRLQSGKFPKTLCGIVGQERQFAAGVLSKPVEGRSFAMAQDVSDSVLRGERHDKVGAATHFHTAGLTFRYPNMAYLAKAGGNVFYEKKAPGTFTPISPHTLVASDEPDRSSGRDAAEPKTKRKASTQLAAATLPIPTPPKREISTASASEE